MANHLKLSSFYGSNIARPYIVFDPQGAEVSARVDRPRVNDALIAWGSKVPVSAGGLLEKPRWEGEEPPTLVKPLNDFQLFIKEKRLDILAVNSHLMVEPDQPAFMASAAVFWKERLSEEERQAYQTRAREMRAQYKTDLAALEQSNPRYKTFREHLKRYKQSVSGIVSAAREQAGPLWKVQRRLMGKGRYSKMGEPAARWASPARVNRRAGTDGPPANTTRSASPSTDSDSDSDSDGKSELEASLPATNAARPRCATRAPDGGQACAPRHGVHLLHQDDLPSPAAAARARNRGRSAPSVAPAPTGRALAPARPRGEQGREGRSATPPGMWRGLHDEPSQSEEGEPSQAVPETPGATQDPTSRPLPRRGARESQQQADPAAALNLQDLDLASPAKRSRRVRP
ncbi:hypothetical protein ACKKBG_A20340 [Auxenochlorella protothecoides x Auxenochlorella symbiontica]